MPGVPPNAVDLLKTVGKNIWRRVSKRDKRKSNAPAPEESSSYPVPTPPPATTYAAPIAAGTPAIAELPTRTNTALAAEPAPAPTVEDKLVDEGQPVYQESAAQEATQASEHLVPEEEAQKPAETPTSTSTEPVFTLAETILVEPTFSVPTAISAPAPAPAPAAAPAPAPAATATPTT